MVNLPIVEYFAPNSFYGCRCSLSRPEADRRTAVGLRFDSKSDLMRIVDLCQPGKPAVDRAKPPGQSAGCMARYLAAAMVLRSLKRLGWTGRLWGRPVL